MRGQWSNDLSQATNEYTPPLTFETAISGRGAGPARKKRYTSSREEEVEEGAQMCLVAKQ